MNKIKKLSNEEKKIRSRLNTLASLILKHNILYHQKDKPEISDSEFDNLIKENDILEKKFPYLILDNSPNKLVGSIISKKFENTRPLDRHRLVFQALGEMMKTDIHALSVSARTPSVTANTKKA